MDRRRFLRAVGTATTAVTASLAGCGAPGGGPAETPPGESPTSPPDGTPTSDGTATPGETGTSTAGAGTTVAMVTDGSEYYFDPIGLIVEPGTTVTWVNESGSHSSTAYVPDNPQSEVRRIPQGAAGWDSGITSEEGTEFDHTLDVEGTYDYYCIPHKSLGMVARIVVGSPGGPAEDGPPPDGEVPESGAIVEQGSISYADFQG